MYKIHKAIERLPVFKVNYIWHWVFTVPNYFTVIECKEPRDQSSKICWHAMFIHAFFSYKKTQQRALPNF